MPPVQAPAARLGEWLDWPRAVSLSRALDGPAAADDDTGPDADADADDCTRVREDLAQAIAADRGWTLFELNAEQSMLDHRVSLLVGLYDLNSEFDANGTAGFFINSSFGIGAELGASGLNGPSIFPVTSLGTRLRWCPGGRGGRSRPLRRSRR